MLNGVNTRLAVGLTVLEKSRSLVEITGGLSILLIQLTLRECSIVI